MATVAEIKPADLKKKSDNNIDENKVYEFELVTRNESARPLDKKTNTPLGNGYPPSASMPNHGIGRDRTTGKARNWRYIEGQSSIWVDDQAELENYEKNEVFALLGQEQNQLEFRDGKMLVRGDASGKLRLEALFVQDYYEGNEKPYRKTVDAMYKFRLNNPDAAIQAKLNDDDKVFKALKQAYECSVDEMLAVASLYSIDISDVSDAGLNKIKSLFLDKAKYDPKNPKALDFFIEVMNNPVTKIKYVFAQGLSQGLLSTEQVPGKLIWAAPGTPICDLLTRKPTDELAGMVMAKDKKIVDVMLELQKQLKIK